jgi:putative oxidoreductase
MNTRNLSTETQLPWTVSAALLTLRLAAGAVFVYHGWGKVFGEHGVAGFAGFLDSLGVPLPALSAWLAALTELVGGLALLVGVGVRLVSLPLAFNMLVAILTVHRTGFDVSQGGMEFALVLLATSIALALTGGGQFSLEHLLRKSPAPVLAR